MLASDVLYFSLSSAATVGGVSAANEDILGYDGGGFSKLFDGSDVGVAGLALDAIDVIGPSEILMSFSAAASIPGIGGTVDDSDVVKFTATELGDTTSGSFSLYFDGSTVGLTGSSEDVDAVSLLDDGRLVLSTTGSFGVTGTSGKDEDLAAFDPASGTWSLYFDGSDVGLASSSSEDVDAAGLDSAGNIYLSTTGSFDVAGVSGADEDVFVFSPTSLGSSTSGSFDSTLFFDGSAHGLSSKDIKGIDIPDAGPALPQLSIDDVQLTEGDSGTTTFVFTVTRSGDVSQQSTVNFSTAAGTATEGVDYVGTSGMLTFPAGDSNQQTIIVQVNGDTDVESNEIFFVDLSNATGGTISDNQGQGTILDDDGEVFPDDPLFSANQWNLHNTGQSGGTFDADIDAPAAWSATTGDASTVVAVLDTGIEYTHEDLYLNIWLNSGEIPAGIASGLTDADNDGIITFRDLNDVSNAGLVSDLNGTGYIDAGDLLADSTWADGSDTDANGFTTISSAGTFTTTITIRWTHRDTAPLSPVSLVLSVTMVSAWRE